ncbi:MAG: histidine--tRNA ligase [Desulfobacterales bacterium]|nr:histidine--tRNA ligase [Desulfobacterales bacterium]
MVTIKALKGFKDILPDEVHVWQWIEATARDVFHRFGFAEIKVPILEKTDLFVRSIGAATDIVEKEMYTFQDRNSASVTMRPEGTAPVLRAFIENGLHVRQPVNRLYTIGPMFRHERPQKGRLRQFHQLSVEVLGSNQPRVDAELMAMAWLLLQELGLSAGLQINSLGCRDCRPAFKRALEEFLARLSGSLCDDCQRRRKTNPLRVLDCKSALCQEHYRSAPSILDHLCQECDDHFQATGQGLRDLDIPFEVNSFMVRGLDYYTRTTFELLTDKLGAQAAVGAGGRYDGLVSQLGGPALPGIGFGMGVERLVLLAGRQNRALAANIPDLYLVALGEAAAARGFVLVNTLRAVGLRVAMDHEGRSLKSQMKQADKQGARYALILGDNELAAGTAPLKNLARSEQETITLPGNELQGWCAALADRLIIKG